MGRERSVSSAMGKPFEKFREERIFEIQESIAFFSNPHKRQRDLWVAKHFLRGYLPAQNLEDVVIPNSDPPDIVFRDMNFEVKEVLDPGRRRHDELREQLEKARWARKYADFLSVGGSIRKCTTAMVQQRLKDEVGKLSKKYARGVQESTDLLFYVNPRSAQYVHALDELASEWGEFDFRSVSFIFHRNSLVICAKHDAPVLLRENVGKLIVRSSYF